MQQFLKQKWNILVVLVLVATFLLGVRTGENRIPAIEKINLENKETQVETTGDFSPFWEAWDSIDEKFVDPEKVADQERIYGAISGLVDSLNDPYSVFLKPDEAKSFEEEIAGNFGGVGMEVGMRDKVLTVIAPLKDTPAFRAGIKSGDKILKIDKTVTSGLSIDQAIRMMRGSKGTSVTLSILHEGGKDPVELTIVRDIINIPTLDTEKRSDGIFVIKLYSFSANSAGLFRDALKEFTTMKTDKLLLDLRGNPGGYLDSAVSISSWFLPLGKVVVTEDYGGKKANEVFRSRGYDIFTDKLKFVILIDGGSASASEIVAGAMQDYKKAKLVGTQSFGKGSVQEVVHITPDTLLKITVAKWLTPNGNSISEKGLKPDYVVEGVKASKDAKADPQLDKAVELLLSGKL